MARALKRSDWHRRQKTTMGTTGFGVHGGLKPSLSYLHEN